MLAESLRPMALRALAARERAMFIALTERPGDREEFERRQDSLVGVESGEPRGEKEWRARLKVVNEQAARHAKQAQVAPGVPEHGDTSSYGLDASDLPWLLASGSVHPAALALLVRDAAREGSLDDALAAAIAVYHRPQVRSELARNYSKLTDSQRRIVDNACLDDTDAYTRALVAQYSTDPRVLTILATCPEAGVHTRAAARLEGMGYEAPPLATPSPLDAAALSGRLNPAWGTPRSQHWSGTGVASALLARGVGGDLPPVDEISAAADAQLQALTRDAQLPGRYGWSKVSEALQLRASGAEDMDVLTILSHELALTWGETANIGALGARQQALVYSVEREHAKGGFARPLRGSSAAEDSQALDECLGDLIGSWFSVASEESASRLRRSGKEVVTVRRYLYLDAAQATELGVPLSGAGSWRGPSSHGLEQPSLASFSEGSLSSWDVQPDRSKVKVWQVAEVPAHKVLAHSSALGAYGGDAAHTGLDVGEVLLPALPPHEFSYSVVLTDGQHVSLPTPPAPTRGCDTGKRDAGKREIRVKASAPARGVSR